MAQQDYELEILMYLLEFELKLIAHFLIDLMKENLNFSLIGKNIDLKIFITKFFYSILFYFLISSANATPEFEGKGGDELGTEISNILANAYQSSKAFDLKVLSILAHKKCWKMYVDVLVRITI